VSSESGAASAILGQPVVDDVRGNLSQSRYDSGTGTNFEIGEPTWDHLLGARSAMRGPRVVVRLQVLQLDEVGPCLDDALAALKLRFRWTVREIRCDSCFLSGSETDVWQNDPARMMWSLLRVEAALAQAGVLPGLRELTLANWVLPASGRDSFADTFVQLLTRLGISRFVVHECCLDRGNGAWLVEQLSTIGLTSLMWRGETTLTTPPVEVRRRMPVRSLSQPRLAAR
jgi:hypothetical protein